MVWAITSSLAATTVIVFTFSSYRYLDVSVPCVTPSTPMCSAKSTIRKFPDLSLPAAPRDLSQLRYVLHRLLTPRHPPYTLTNLITTLPASRLKKIESLCGLFLTIIVSLDRPQVTSALSKTRLFSVICKLCCVLLLLHTSIGCQRTK